MECNDIQEKLSAYMEGVISDDERSVIEEHLKSCQACRTSLDDLEKTVSYVKTLEVIEPPAWLTQKVMARVREEAASKAGFLHKLFYPLHIKLPVQAIATVLIAVSAFYIFKTIQPEVRHSGIAVDETTTLQVLPEDKDVSSKQKEADKSIPAIGRIPGSIETGDRSQRDRALTKDTAVSKGKVDTALGVNEGKRFSSAKEDVMKHEFKERLPAEPMKQLYRAEEHETADRIEEVSGMQEPAEKQEEMKALKEQVVGGVSVKERKSAGEKEQYPPITLAVDNLKDFEKDSAKIVKQLNCLIIKTERSGDRMLMIVRCDEPKMNELLMQLRRIGEMKDEGGAVEQGEERREISIELVEK